MICKFKPILTDLIIQGNREGVFHVNKPMLTTEFIHYWEDSSLFKWTPEERIARGLSIQPTFEHLFGVPSGKFDLQLLRETVHAKFSF
ncbi:hypothetical protein [Bacillus cereus]|uniref:hypothetical protein n=1 Tax=Bacillus cereus TaxID=1396 RepID=UPI003D30FE52